MEAALASGLLKAAGGKLVSLIASEFDSIMSVKKDLSELKEILQLIASRLPALQEREMESNPSFPLVKKLKNVAYDIGDLIDDVHLEAEKQIIESGGEKHAVADCFCAKPKSSMFRCKMAHKIKAIKVRLDEIVKQTSDMNTILPNLPVDQPAPYRNNATAELNLLGTAEESKIPKRDQEKDKIISKLVESNEGDNVLIVSIIGLGGSGKTTLAKHICQDEKIKKHFKDRIFRVHVSREFDLDRLIGKLFEDITKGKSDLHSRPHMVDEISKKLSNTKFLLVLDDAWNKNRLEWEQFMCHVNRGTQGCLNLRCMPSGFGQLTRLKMLGLFVVGCGGDGARISEIENLDMLSGDMKIKNLKYLTDPGDAEKACLKRKNNIQCLELNWYSIGTEEELASDMQKDLGVLDALEPPSEIEKLQIFGYGGLHLPRWMRKQSDSYLEGVALKQTRPPRFLRLTRLLLWILPNLKHMKGLRVLPSLKYLVLYRMPNLEELWTTTNGGRSG